MANQLEVGAEGLKRKYGTRHHELIDRNLKRVSEQMAAAPSSIAIQEGVIALSEGLPPRSRPLTLTRKRAYRRKDRGKQFPKR
jgi:hypothetical protein